MNCRQCGAEIADKALVCYRCGTATSEPRFKPRAARKRSRFGPLGTMLVIAVLVLSALYLTQFASGETTGMLRWAILVLAAVTIAIRIVARRS